MKRFAILKILILTMFVSCGAVEEQSEFSAVDSAQCSTWHKQAYEFYAKADFHRETASVYYDQANAKQKECNPIIDFLLMSTCTKAATKLREEGTYHLTLSNTYSAQGTKLLKQYNEKCN